MTGKIEFGFRRLLVIGTGAIGVCSLPGWVGWLRESHPDLDFKVVLTRQATSFVTPTAVMAIGGRPVLTDVWPTEPQVHAPHVELIQWADAVAVYPATFHFVSRFATGMADTPSMLALQCMTAPIGIAPSLPPGGLQSHGFQKHLAELRQRPNVVVAASEEGRSVTTGKVEAATSVPLPTLLNLLERQRRKIHGEDQ
ncbi:hypothetical protein GCM10027589_13210 [Actinocorallia lasiicapitis]